MSNKTANNGAGDGAQEPATETTQQTEYCSYFPFDCDNLLSHNMVEQRAERWVYWLAIDDRVTGRCAPGSSANNRCAFRPIPKSRVKPFSVRSAERGQRDVMPISLTVLLVFSFAVFLGSVCGRRATRVAQRRSHTMDQWQIGVNILHNILLEMCNSIVWKRKQYKLR